MKKQEFTPELLVRDAAGIYIPQIFAQNYRDKIVNKEELKEELDTLCKGPDEEHYWEDWETVLQSCTILDDNGVEMLIVQNGDLWAYDKTKEIPEDFFG